MPANTPELRATLVWRDPAASPQVEGNHIVNDLTLEVISPTAQYYYQGNYGLGDGLWSASSALPGARDHWNTVENVFVQNPEAGAWWVRVRTDSLGADGYPGTTATDTAFALVVSGVNIPIPPGEGAEWNGDGVVDSKDVTSFLDAYLKNACDIDRDGLTTTSDLTLFLGAWFTPIHKQEK